MRVTKDLSGESKDRTAPRAEEPDLGRTLRILDQWFTRWDSENSSISISWKVVSDKRNVYMWRTGEVILAYA